MIIDLQTLIEGLHSFDFTSLAEELDLLDIEMTLHGPIRTSCVATLAGDTVFVEGFVFSQAHMECCRCLKEFPFNLAIPFRRLFQKGTPDERETDNDDIEWIARDALSIDITATIREAIILEIPMKPLCSEGCAGLCPYCGHDLNKGPCGCHVEEIDPRVIPQKFFDKNFWGTP